MVSTKVSTKVSTSPATVTAKVSGARLASFACALLGLLAAGAQAQTYKWTDSQGRVQYTDRLPTEAVNRGNVQLTKQGVAKNAVDPALTGEQRRAIEERLEREREA